MEDKISAAKPVVLRVLETFISSVAAEEGYGEAAERLRATLIDEGVRSEASVKAALFGPGDA